MNIAGNASIFATLWHNSSDLRDTGRTVYCVEQEIVGGIGQYLLICRLNFKHLDNIEKNNNDYSLA